MNNYGKTECTRSGNTKSHEALPLIRSLLAAMAASALIITSFLSSAMAEGVQSVQQAGFAAYRDGRMEDAIKDFEGAVEQAAEPAAKWAAITVLMDVCAYTYEYKCVADNVAALVETAKQINDARITRPELVFVIAFERYMAGDLAGAEKFIGRDFALTTADPVANPSLATRLYLLNAMFYQHRGDFDNAREYLRRSFASVLRINSDGDRFEIAALLSTLIATTLENHDFRRAAKWLAITEPLIRVNPLAPNSFNRAQFLLVEADIFFYAAQPKIIHTLLSDARPIIEHLQTSSPMKQYMLSTIAVQEAAAYAMEGNRSEMQSALALSPLHARRDAVIASGRFSNYMELQYAVAEIYFDTIAGDAADPRWEPLLKQFPNWPLSSDLAATVTSFQNAALALLRPKTDPERAALLIAAAKDRLISFETGFADGSAFPLPGFLDRIVLGLALAPIANNPDELDGNLLVGSVELLNRNPRYSISDSLSALAAQADEQSTRAMHALLRLSDEEFTWQSQKLQDLLDTVKARKPFNPKIWTAQMTASQYDHTLRRLRQAIVPRQTKLPTLQELQSALSDAEAFVGYAIGAGGALSVCVTHTRIIAAPVVADREKFVVDAKLLQASFAADYPPSDKLDSQYPVDAAVRIYHALFDGLGECLKGATHIIYLPPVDLAWLPISALLIELPPALPGGGYDLGKAHWLIRNFAISNVASICDFLSARTLSKRASGDYSFLGVGDPDLSGRLSDGNSGATELARRGVTTTTGMLADLGTRQKRLTSSDKLGIYSAAIRTLFEAWRPTEEKVLALPLERYQIIHFATHGLLRGDIPGCDRGLARSHTSRYARQPEQRPSLASGIANLNLSARLVVLSACNTANFDLSEFGSQVQGLADAFAAAGVPSTVASLWPVETHTSKRIMVEFYRQFLGSERLPFGVALQRAIIQAIDKAPSPAYHHPRFWHLSSSHRGWRRSR